MTDPAIDYVIDASVPVPMELESAAMESGLKIVNENGLMCSTTEAASVLWGVCMILAAERRGLLDENDDRMDRDVANDFLKYISSRLGDEGLNVEDFIIMAEKRLATRSH